MHASAISTRNSDSNNNSVRRPRPSPIRRQPLALETRSQNARERTVPGAYKDKESEMKENDGGFDFKGTRYTVSNLGKKCIESSAVAKVIIDAVLRRVAESCQREHKWVYSVRASPRSWKEPSRDWSRQKQPRSGILRQSERRRKKQTEERSSSLSCKRSSVAHTRRGPGRQQGLRGALSRC